MSEEQTIQINVEPNLIAISGVRVLPTEEEFNLQILSGNMMRQYSMSPKHAKRLSMLLNNSIAEYESKFGELKTELPTVNNQTETKKFGFNVEEERKDK